LITKKAHIEREFEPIGLSRTKKRDLS